MTELSVHGELDTIDVVDSENLKQCKTQQHSVTATVIRHGSTVSFQVSVSGFNPRFLT